MGLFGRSETCTRLGCQNKKHWMSGSSPKFCKKHNEEYRRNGWLLIHYEHEEWDLRHQLLAKQNALDEYFDGRKDYLFKNGGYLYGYSREEILALISKHIPEPIFPSRIMCETDLKKLEELVLKYNRVHTDLQKLLNGTHTISMYGTIVEKQK